MALAGLLSQGVDTAQTVLPKGIVDGAGTNHTIEDIVSGRVSYSRKCGWIDWGHAGGEGPTELIESVLSQTPMQLSPKDEGAVKEFAAEKKISLNRYVPIVYFQQMKKTSVGVTIQAGIRSVYLVRKDLHRKTREGVAWRIFKEVSEQFEKMQGDVPYAILPSTAASSFGVGDLTGDKISFYSALRGYSKEKFEGICRPYTADKSVRQLESQREYNKGQARWRNLPAILSVPKIPRGVVLTVVQGQQFFGSYR